MVAAAYDAVEVEEAIEEVDPIRDASWDQDVLLHPAHEVFHLSAWARVLCGTYRLVPKYLRARSDNKAVAFSPLLELNSPWTGRRAVSLPFSDECVPLSFGEGIGERCLPRMIEEGKRRRWKYLELRGWPRPAAGVAVSAEFYGHVLDLKSGPSQILRSMSPSTRRAVSHSKRTGVEVQHSRTPESMEHFYRLHMRTRRRHGLPPQSLEFFERVHEEVIARALGFVTMAYVSGRPVAGAVFLCSGKNATYKYAASDERWQGFRGNNAVIWRAIEHLCESGIERLSFGRTSPNNSGLRTFKAGWGADETKLQYFRYCFEKNEWVGAADKAYGTHNWVFSRMPLRLNRLIGTLIYPHLQ